MSIQLTNRYEVSARLGRALTDAEDAVFDALVRDISAMLYALYPRIPVTLPIPDAVVGVASRLAIEGLAMSTTGSVGNVASESLGGYSVVYASGGGASDNGLSLTPAMESALRPWTRSSIGTVQIDPTGVIAI